MALMHTESIRNAQREDTESTVEMFDRDMMVTEINVQETTIITLLIKRAMIASYYSGKDVRNAIALLV